jgi:hypothetical protein
MDAAVSKVLVLAQVGPLPHRHDAIGFRQTFFPTDSVLLHLQLSGLAASQLT